MSGFPIAFIAVDALGAECFLGGVWICVCGYYRTWDALDRVLAGNRKSWLGVALGFALIYGGAGLSVFVPFYLLAVSY